MSQAKAALKLVKVVVVVAILAGFISFLLPSLSNAKRMAKQSLERGEDYGRALPTSPADKQGGDEQPKGVPLAHVKTFDAVIDLTPTKSIGTAKPESIYIAKFAAKIEAINPSGSGQCELKLPLPPQIISLSELTFLINGEPSSSLFVDGDKLVWRGTLNDQKRTQVEVKYTAVGKGLYALEPPPGRIIDTFATTLTAHNANLNLLELSLQPEKPQNFGDGVMYKWKFSNLMYGKPIYLDVLGVAGVDQLSELRWLAPISVLVFGAMVALLVLAHRPDLLDTWMLLLVVGAFAGAYPLMYFAQEFMSLPAAMVASAALVIAIIGVRAVTLFGVRMGVFGVVLLSAGVMGLTLVSAIFGGGQGVLLTAGSIGVLVVTMVLLPKAQRSFTAISPPAPPAAATTIAGHKQDAPPNPGSH